MRVRERGGELTLDLPMVKDSDSDSDCDWGHLFSCRYRARYILAVSGWCGLRYAAGTSVTRIVRRWLGQGLGYGLG